ncbi:MAG: diacylglycerol kinase family lipid kinase [Nitrospiraceae bacterium]|nr:MAG: diacylglycerol kinase family lipid kinase [Nitrospiraceae bacterium]
MRSLIILIGNPAARGASLKKFESASVFLRGKGFDTKILLTEKSNDATYLASEAVREKPHMIMAAGGDGTINEVINGMVKSDVPLAILPLGTTNVLAKELGIPEEMTAALSTAISKAPRMVNLGRIELNPDTDSAYVRYFCLMAGIGFDGKTVHDVNPEIKRKSGKAAYVLSGLKNLLHYAPNQLFYNIDGKELTGFASITGKSSRYGGNFKITPDADLSDPALYTCIFQGNRRSDLIRYVYRTITGSLSKEKDIIYLKSTSVEVHGTAHIQLDGDYIGLTPAKITVEKDALKIIY